MFAIQISSQLPSEKASQDANTSFYSEYFALGLPHDLGNSWLLQNAPYLSNDRSAYTARREIASTAYPALTRDQALYPSYGCEARTPNIPSTGTLLLTFSGRPGLKPLGYRNHTACDVDGVSIPRGTG